MNTLDQPVSVQAHGKWFSFKPQEIKLMHNPKLTEFLSQKRLEDGLVEVPEDLMGLSKDSIEYMQGIADCRKKGIRSYVEKQNGIIRNLEMSLRRDYETSGQKGNFLFEASQGELQAYKNLKKYKEFEQQEHLNIADEVQKARDDLYGDKSRPSPLESAKKE